MSAERGKDPTHGTGRARGLMRVAAIATMATGALGGAAVAQQRAVPAAAVPATPVRPNFELGFEERVRTEAYDNITDYDAAKVDKRQHWRFRTRAWLKAPVTPRLDFYIGLNNETRKIVTPDVKLTRDEVVFESLYVDFRPTARTTMRIGRQNITRGEGFILLEGNPLDGSRSIYFNAISVTHALAPKATVEFLAISNPSRDTYLPAFGGPDRQLAEWNERAVGAYYTDKRRSGTDVQAYYLFKRESDDYRSAAHPLFQPDRNLHVAGARLARTFNAAWSATAEFAAQAGTETPGTAIRAWGGYAYARRVFAGAWRPTFTAGVIALSGDDPSTSTIEGWNPVMSRWPKWSELYIYSQAPERGVGYWSNTLMWQAEATARPHKYVDIRATYYRMGAFHQSGRAGMFGEGRTRGDLLQGRADLRLPGPFMAHLLYERFLPGSFYRGRDAGHFFRFEVSRAFQSAKTVRALVR